MPDLSKKTVSIYINDQAAQDALKTLQAQADKFTVSIAKGQAAGKSMVAEIAKLETLKPKLADLNNQIAQHLPASLTQLRTSLAQTQAAWNKMMPSAAEYDAQGKKIIGLKTEIDHLGSQIQVVKTHSDTLQGGFKSLGLQLLQYLGVYGAVDVAVNFFKGSIEQANKAEQAVTKLKNALENAGRSDLFEKLNTSAEKLGETFKAINPNDIKDVFTKLIDYGKLSENQITSLTTVIINYAAKQNISLQESTDVMTRALEGNVRGLKTYGINIKDAHTVTERFGLIINDLGDKVKGAEAVFEETAKGGWARFQERIVKIKESFGDMLFEMVSVKKSADTLFDEAKVKTDNYESSLRPLLMRYDQLVTSTKLNKDQEAELHGIIQKIVDILPNAATEIDKYGRALDINRGKVTLFLEENKKFLAEKEYKAVEDITNRTLETITKINEKRNEIAKGTTQHVYVSGGTGGAGVTTVTKPTTPEEFKQSQSELRTLQQQLVTDAGTLTDKYGKELPAAVKKGVDAINVEFTDLNIANKNANKYSLNWYNDQIAEVTKNFNAATKGTKEFTDAQKKLVELTTQRDNILHPTIGGGDPNANAARDKARAEAAKKLTEEFARQRKVWDDLIKSINEYSRDLDQLAINKINFDAEEKIQQLTDARNKLSKADRLKTAQEYADALVKTEDNRLAQFAKLSKDWQLVTTPRDPFGNLKITGTQQSITNFNAAGIAAAELAAVKLTGNKKLAAEKIILDMKMVAEIINTKATGLAKEAIEDKFRKKKAELDLKVIEQWKKDAQNILSGAQGIANVMSIINSGKDAQDAARITQIDKQTSADQARLQRSLNGKLISQKEYDRQTKVLNDKADKEKYALEVKQFERSKKMQITQAIMSGAQAILSVLAAIPGPLDIATLGAARIIQIAVAAATTVAEVAVISKQKPPPFAKGGVFPGPLHNQGGMPVYNPRTGKKVAELEGGEPILSRRTYANNRAVVDALLNSSMHGNGEPITHWHTQPYRGVNFPGINQSIMKHRMYERGGVFTGDAASIASNNVTLGNMTAIMNANLAATNVLIDKLDQPWKGFVTITDVNAQQAILDNIKKQTTIPRT